MDKFEIHFFVCFSEVSTLGRVWLFLFQCMVICLPFIFIGALSWRTDEGGGGLYKWTNYDLKRSYKWINYSNFEQIV